jgi:xanthine dehydrogenase YagS FAD-binding subunit
MRSFEYATANGLEQAIALLGEGDGLVRPLAGGTDLLPLMKADVAHPRRLVDLKRLPELATGIQETASGVSIGALTTLSEVASNQVLRSNFAAVAEAAELAATPQLRNMATVGGNLLQRPRCWYFRSAHFNCWLKGGTECHARDGENQLHAVLGDSPCVATYPSDPPAALLAFDAEVTLSRSGASARTVPLAEFFVLPTDEHRLETVVQPGEILTSIQLPHATGTRSSYLKAMNRKVWAFALVGVAAVVEGDGDRVRRARLVLNGVAPIPWRAHAAERELEGSALTEATIARAAEAALAEAHPLSKNGYKVQLAEGLIKQALRLLQRL